MMSWKSIKAAALGAAAVVMLSACNFSPYTLPLPGGADLGDKPYKIKVEFRDVLDLVPQSGVRVDDVAVGKVTNIKLKDWKAVVTLEINDDAKLPENAVAKIRQTSLLGEKFVSLRAPKTGAQGHLKNGGLIPISRSGRNPEIEEVLGAASLLFNGGGIEKTQTIVKELNNTLDGNEPEVRELLDSTDSLLTQLDDNKQELITSLEKVNNLAIQTNKQKDAITGALDNLPAALNVVNEQRDDLVKLLQALANLGDVGTRVIKESKNDTLADLKALGPILQNLAGAGDSLSKNLTTLLTFPFTDGAVGDDGTLVGAKDIVKGDFANLSANLDLNLDTLVKLLNPDAKSGSNSLKDQLSNLSKTDPSKSVQDLVNLIGGLVPSTVTQDDTESPSLPGLPNIPGVGKTQDAPKTPTAPSESTAPIPKLPVLCSLLGNCRSAAANDLPNLTRNDVGNLLLEPVVAK